MRRIGGDAVNLDRLESNQRRRDWRRESARDISDLDQAPAVAHQADRFHKGFRNTRNFKHHVRANSTSQLTYSGLARLEVGKLAQVDNFVGAESTRLRQPQIDAVNR